MDLDPDAARAILEPYPELWEHWQREMFDPDREQKYGSGGVREMHDPIYLREVVRQHRWLTEGPGDRLDPRLARRLEEILQRCAEVRDERARQLSSPWVRALCNTLVTEWHDPDFVGRRVEAALNPSDPFSPDRLRVQTFVALVKAGATVTVTNMATREEVDRWRRPASRKDAAHTN